MVCRFLAGFPKSRVYAKLLMRLISERYQTFNGQIAGVDAGGHDTAAHRIGKQINWYATRGEGAKFAARCAFVRGAWIEDSAWKS